jgi:hypothetical protein
MKWYEIVNANSQIFENLTVSSIDSSVDGRDIISIEFTQLSPYDVEPMNEAPRIVPQSLASHLRASIVIAGGANDDIDVYGADYELIAADYIDIIVPISLTTIHMTVDSYLTSTVNSHLISNGVHGASQWNDIIKSTTSMNGNGYVIGNDGDDTIDHVGYGGIVTICSDHCDGNYSPLTVFISSLTNVLYVFVLETS